MARLSAGKQINVIEWLNFSAINVPQEYKNVVEDRIKTKKLKPGSSVKSQTPKVYFRRENYYNTLLIKKI